MSRASRSISTESFLHTSHLLSFLHNHHHLTRNSMQIANTIFYVTGGASGLGAATVRGLHAKGAHVGIFDLDLDGALALVKELGSERTIACEVDVCEEEPVVEAIKACDDKWPGVTVGGVVNCGGVGMAGKVSVCVRCERVRGRTDDHASQQTISADGEPFVSCPVSLLLPHSSLRTSRAPQNLDTFKKVVEINLVGTFNVSRLVAARIVRDAPKPIPKPTGATLDRGVIVNTASAAAFEGQMGQVSYSASKGGVVGMGMPMAR